MGVWHSTFTDLMRSRYSALIAYGGLLVGDGAGARDLADRAVADVFARRRAPRDVRAAEFAVREWMAAQAVVDGAPVDRVVAVLVAIDGRDADGVHAVLKKAAPDPLPEVTAEDASELRRLFSEAAAVYATPSGGNGAVIAPAKRRRRSALVGASVGTMVAVVGVGAAAYAGVTFLPGTVFGTEGPTASPSPSPTLLAVTWNPQPDALAALADFEFPQCGDEFAPAAQGVSDVTAVASLDVYDDDANMGPWILLGANFESTNKQRPAVLAGQGSFVITLDDEVVYVSGADYNGVELVVVNRIGASNGGAGLSRSNLCDAREAREEFEREFDERFEDLDWENITADEQAKVDEAWAKFEKKWSVFPSGTYKIYQVSPIVFGEQLALAQAFLQEGIDSVNGLEYDISWSELSRDPLVSAYCTGSWDAGDWQCDPPADVLKKALTREIDPEAIDLTEGGVAISEPLEYVVD